MDMFATNEDPVELVDQEKVLKLLKLIKNGCTRGTGVFGSSGKMCIEAAVCYAYGHEESDEPKCVHADVRQLVISLNDFQDADHASTWSSRKARAKGLQRLAIAQLGSASEPFNIFKFRVHLAREMCKSLLGYCLRHIHATLQSDCFSRTITYGWRVDLSDIIKQLEKPSLVTLFRTQDKSAAISTSLIALNAESPTVPAVAYGCLASAFRELGSLAFNLSAMSSMLSHYNDIDVYFEHVLTHAVRFAELVHAVRHAAGTYQQQGVRRPKVTEVRDRILTRVADCVVEALERANSPGVKFLHLIPEE